MSLINEALKKAQRQRHDAAAPTTNGESGAINKRGQPRSAQTTLLIVVGAVLLVVISIAITAFWMTRSPSSTPLAAAKATPAPDKTAESAAVAVTFNAPVNEPKPVRGEGQPTTTKANAKAVAAANQAAAASKPSSAAAPVPAAAAPASAPSETPTRVATAAATVPAGSRPAEQGQVSPPALANPAPAAPASVATNDAGTVAATAKVETPAVAKSEPPPRPQPDERIQRFLDNLKVAGVRPSGADSKVLMNDRVYRLNDFVDRSLGLRLTKVTRESLTFTDANGVTYAKDL